MDYNCLSLTNPLLTNFKNDNVQTAHFFPPLPHFTKNLSIKNSNMIQEIASNNFTCFNQGEKKLIVKNSLPFFFLLALGNWKEGEKISPCTQLYKDLCLYDNRKVDLLDMETAFEKSVSKKMLIIIVAIYFLHVVPTKQRLNF